MDVTKLEHSWHATFDPKRRFSAPGWLLSVWRAVAEVHGFDAFRHFSISVHTQNMLSQPGAMQSYLQKTRHSQWKRFQWCLVDSSSPTLSPPTMLWYRLLHGQHTAWRWVGVGSKRFSKQFFSPQLDWWLACFHQCFKAFCWWSSARKTELLHEKRARQRWHSSEWFSWWWVYSEMKEFERMCRHSILKVSILHPTFHLHLRGWIETFQQAIFLLNWIDDLPAFTNVSKPFVDDPVLERQSSCMKKEHGSAGTAANGFHTYPWSGCNELCCPRSVCFFESLKSHHVMNERQGEFFHYLATSRCPNQKNPHNPYSNTKETTHGHNKK